MAAEFGPLGLVHKSYGTFTRDVAFTLMGAVSNAEAGNVAANTPSTLMVQWGPLGLTSKPRQFSPKDTGVDVFVNITGALIQGQAAVPDSSNATIYIDDGGAVAKAGSVTSSTAFLAGAQSASEAGTVSVRVDAPTNVTGASSQAIAASIFAGEGVGVSIVGAAGSADAGTVAAAYDWQQSVTGAVISAAASESGVDSNFDLSVVIEGAASVAQAGSVADAQSAVVSGIYPGTNFSLQLGF